MKKLLAVLLVLVMVLSFAACGSSGGAEDEGDVLAQIKEKGYIDFVTEPYFAPYEFIDPSLPDGEQIVGADIKLAQYIADKIGVELKITGLDYSAVLAGIADGKYDMAISAIAYSPGREAAMNLSDGYYFGGDEESEGFGFVCRTEDVDKYNSIESLADAVVTTQSGSVQEAILNEQVTASKEVKIFANMTDCYIAVAEGKADVCICDRGSAKLYADANGGLSVPEFQFVVDPLMNSTVVAMPLEDTESLEAIVNECIAELIAEGTINSGFDEAEDYAKTLGL